MLTCDTKLASENLLIIRMPAIGIWSASVMAAGSSEAGSSTMSVFSFERRASSCSWQRLLRQYLYFCTRKESKLSTEVCASSFSLSLSLSLASLEVCSRFSSSFRLISSASFSRCARSLSFAWSCRSAALQEASVSVRICTFVLLKQVN